MSELMIKRFEEINVFFMEDGWFNATSVAKKFNKEVNDWVRQDEVFEYAVELANSLSLLNPGSGGVNEKLQFLQNCTDREIRRALIPQFLKDVGLMMTRRGSLINGGGTWLHPDLSIVFARWLSAKFAVWCDKQIKEILLSRENRYTGTYQRRSFPVYQNEALGFTQCMIEEDEYCKAHRVSLDQLIKVECGLWNPAFIRELTNLTFRIFTGFEVKDFRRGWGIARGSRLRTRLFVDSNLRRAIDDLELQVRHVIQEFGITDYGEIYTLVEDAANSIAAHCRVHRISLGRSVPVNLRLVS